MGPSGLIGLPVDDLDLVGFDVEDVDYATVDDLPAVLCVRNSDRDLGA